MKNSPAACALMALLLAADIMAANADPTAADGPLPGDYLGQTPPGAEPVVFARGIVSTDWNEHSAPSFSPDGNEVFWWANRPPGPDNAEWETRSMTMRRENGRWSAPQASPFGEMAALSPDGRRAYFGQDEDIWVAVKGDDGWGMPRCLDLVGKFPELKSAFMPTVARNGTLYFMAYTPGPRNDFGIFRAELVDGEYAKPQVLPPTINRIGSLNWTPFIASDESFLLFSSNRRDPENDPGDLYVTRRQPDGSWSEPASLGAPVNSPAQEVFPGLSPDGRYLFFCRDTPGRNNDVYWVSAATIPTLAGGNVGEIHEAATAGDLAKVRALLDADPSLLESKDEIGNTPLISACFPPHPLPPRADVARFLLARGANVNAKNSWGGTALYLATADADLVRDLIAKGAEINVEAFVGITPLHRAATGGNVESARLLIEHGANINARSSDDGTALHQIINLSHLLNDRRDANAEMARLLLESGIKLQAFAFGNTELHLAALKGQAHLVPLLIAHGADVNAKNDFGHTALFYAARHGYRSVADALVVQGANADDIVQANYGTPVQLTSELRDGEAYIWPLRGPAPSTGYAVKTKTRLLIFDPPRPDESPEVGLANGNVNPKELAGQQVTVLLTRPRHPHVAPSLSALAQALPGAVFVLGFEPNDEERGEGAVPAYRLAVAHETMSVDGLRIDPIPALLKSFVGRANGMGYLVQADGIRVLHCGTHATSGKDSQLDEYRKQIDFLKPLSPIDFAILPISGRHLAVAYEPFLYLIDHLSPSAVYLAAEELASEEPRKCTEALHARDVTVDSSEGGVALGQRFHFVRPRPR